MNCRQITTTALVAIAFTPTMPAAEEAKITYPPTKQVEVTDDYHGTKIADPYRWLEDDNSGETKAWVQAQNEVTSHFLESIPQRTKISDRLTELWNYERFGTPLHRGGHWFYSHNSGLQNQPVLLVAESLDGEPRGLLDPNTLSSDGTTSLTNWSPSEDGKLLAYGLSKAGSDWEEFRVRDVITGKDRDDVLRWVKFSGASWAKDGRGFYYSRYEEPKPGAALTAKNENHKLCFHKLGTPQNEDAIIYERPDHPDWNLGAHVTDDGHFLLVTASHGTDPKHRIFYKDLTRDGAEITGLLTDADASYDFIDHIGTTFYFSTDLDAPRFRVIAINLEQPQREHWREIISQSPDKLEGANILGDQIIADYLHDAHSAVRCFSLDGKFLRDVPLPDLGSAHGFGGRRDDKETFYSFTSFTEPGDIRRYDVATGRSEVWRKPKVGFDATPYETKQVFVTSKDGTKVPMFITQKRDLKAARNGWCRSATPRRRSSPFRVAATEDCWSAHA